MPVFDDEEKEDKKPEITIDKKKVKERIRLNEEELGFRPQIEALVDAKTDMREFQENNPERVRDHGFPTHLTRKMYSLEGELYQDMQGKVENADKAISALGGKIKTALDEEVKAMLKTMTRTVQVMPDSRECAPSVS